MCMYAIVEIAGHQYKVQKDQQVYVNRLSGDEGSEVSFDRVLLTDDNGSIEVGAPAIEGIKVDAKIVSHLKADKVIVFKKKRRKGYRVKNGHRQAISLIEITGIGKGSAKKATPAKAEKKAEAPKKEQKNEVSENLVTRAEHRAEEQHLEVNVDKLLHDIGTATKAEAQDLKKINGIGPAYEEKLNVVGIYTYQQIANLKAADKKLLSELSGITVEKINSEEWVKQAKALLKEEN